MAKLRILLGDDHTILRSGLRKILQEQPDWEIVGEAGDGREAVQQALELQPDVAILDIGMPFLNGIEATRQIVRRLPDIRILILSMHSNEAYITAGAQGRRQGLPAQGFGGHRSDSGVAAVAERQVVLQPGGLEGHARRLRPPPRRTRGLPTATTRCPSASARSSSSWPRATATRRSRVLLSVSPATVETHRAHILQKLDLHNTAELVLYAVRRGVIS